MKEALDLAVKHLLGVVPNIIAIYLYRSFGTKYQTASSDLDLAVLALEPIDKVFLWRLAQEIAIQIDRDVDIVDLKEASVVFRFQVLTTGKRIFCSDNIACDTIENTYLSMYLRFNEERLDIIKDKWEK